MGFLLEGTTAEVLQELPIFIPAADSLEQVLHSP